MRLDEWMRLRECRLRALADSPDAFGGSYDDAVRLPDTEWGRRASASVEGTTTRTFCVGDERWTGMSIGLDTPEYRPGALEIVGVWVSPDERGRGVGRGLIEAVERWARPRGDLLRISADERNESAIALYERCGFQPVEVVAWPERRSRLVRMHLELR